MAGPNLRPSVPQAQSQEKTDAAGGAVHTEPLACYKSMLHEHWNRNHGISKQEHRAAQASADTWHLITFIQQASFV
eukprot:1161947-Pelagomonas_calceolata.AAC.8